MTSSCLVQESGRCWEHARWVVLTACATDKTTRMTRSATLKNNITVMSHASPLKNCDWRRSSWTFNWKSLYKKFLRPRAASIMRPLSRGRPRDNSAVHGASEDVPGTTYDVPGVSYPIPWTSGDCPRASAQRTAQGHTVWHRLVPSPKRLSTGRPDCWGSANHSADALWTGSGLAHSTSETGSWCPVAVREMLRRLC